MKKISSLTLIVFLNLNSFTQTLFLGPELGMNVIQIKSENIGRDFQLGCYGGASFQYISNDWFSIKSGIYFSQGKQETIKRDTTAFDFFGLADSTFEIPGVDLNTYNTTTTRQTQSYIQIPVLANIEWKGLNLFAGGYVGFMISAKRKENTVSTTPFMTLIDLDTLGIPPLFSSFLPQPYAEEFLESSEKNNLRLFDYGLKIGFGYQLDRININCAYSLGFPDFRIDKADDGSKKHMFLQLSVSYMIALNKSKEKSSLR